MDRALLPYADETGEDWKLYTQTVAAESAVDRERRVAGRSATLSTSRFDGSNEDVPSSVFWPGS